MPNTIEKFDFRVGDIVRVSQIVPDIRKREAKALSKTAKAIKRTAGEEKTEEGTRTQIFEGTLIAHKHGREPGATVTVRRIASGGIGVEKIFPLHSPVITKIEVVSRPTKRPRRAKLYFLRGRVGREAHRLGVGEAVKQETASLEIAEIKEKPEGTEIEKAPEEIQAEESKT